MLQAGSLFLKGRGWGPQTGNPNDTVEIQSESELAGKDIPVVFLLCSWGAPFWEGQLESLQSFRPCGLQIRCGLSLEAIPSSMSP